MAAAGRSGWRSASLVWLVVGSIAPDLLDVAYAALGICNPDGSYSHTVPIATLLALLLGGTAFLATRSRATAMATGVMVLLHLPPDLVTGYKVYWPGGPMIGLRLYRMRFADFVVEAGVVTTGWWLLRHSGAGPRWAASRRALAVVLLAQGLADVSAFGLKPTACDPSQLTRAVSLRSSSSRWPRNSPIAAKAAM